MRNPSPSQVAGDSVGLTGRLRPLRAPRLGRAELGRVDGRRGDRKLWWRSDLPAPIACLHEPRVVADVGREEILRSRVVVDPPGGSH